MSDNEIQALKNNQTVWGRGLSFILWYRTQMMGVESDVVSEHIPYEWEKDTPEK